MMILNGKRVSFRNTIDPSQCFCMVDALGEALAVFDH